MIELRLAGTSNSFRCWVVTCCNRFFNCLPVEKAVRNVASPIACNMFLPERSSVRNSNIPMSNSIWRKNRRPGSNAIWARVNHDLNGNSDACPTPEFPSKPLTPRLCLRWTVRLPPSEVWPSGRVLFLVRILILPDIWGASDRLWSNSIPDCRIMDYHYNLCCQFFKWIFTFLFEQGREHTVCHPELACPPLEGFGIPSSSAGTSNNNLVAEDWTMFLTVPIPTS